MKTLKERCEEYCFDEMEVDLMLQGAELMRQMVLEELSLMQEQASYAPRRLAYCNAIFHIRLLGIDEK